MPKYTVEYERCKAYILIDANNDQHAIKIAHDLLPTIAYANGTLFPRKPRPTELATITTTFLTHTNENGDFLPC